MIGEATAIMLLLIGSIGFVTSMPIGIEFGRIAGVAVALIGTLMMLAGAMIIDAN